MAMRTILLLLVVSVSACNKAEPTWKYTAFPMCQAQGVVWPARDYGNGNLWCMAEDVPRWK